MSEGEATPGSKQSHAVDTQAEDSSPEAVRRLLGVLEADYAALLERLSTYLRSRDAAEDALHDAYVKLRAEPNIGHLRNPQSYLYRMAINFAANRRRSDQRFTLTGEIYLNDLPAECPDPERIALACDEMDRLLAALHALPTKRRLIFLARWRDEKSQPEIATVFRLHLRSVQKELSKAEAHLRRVLRRPKGPLR